MGFDITYHPISVEQMTQWYFSKLLDVADGNIAALEKIGEEYHLKPFFMNEYIDTMRVASKVEENIAFEKLHVFYIAIVQGYFSPYYYTRGTAFSFLMDDKPQMKKYVTPWEQLKPDFIHSPVNGGLVENYSGGVYIAPEEVVQLLDDYEKQEETRKIIDDFYVQNLPVFIKALQYAKENNLGLLEASEVVEPNPLDLNNSESYSNLLNCDTEGALIYEKIALKQLGRFIQESEKNKEQSNLSTKIKNGIQNLLKKLPFGKNKE